jgi:hypothetical protein
MLCILPLVLCCVKLLHPSVGGHRDRDPDRQSFIGRLIVLRLDSAQPSEAQIIIYIDMQHLRGFFNRVKVNCSIPSQ